MAKRRLVLLPTPGVGHIISMVEMAKLFLRHHPGTTESQFAVTVLVPAGPASTPAVDTFLHSVAASGLDIDLRELPPVEPPAEDDGPQDFMSLLMQKHKPHVRDAVSDLQRSSAVPVAALVIDFFATTMVDVAVDLDVPCYVYLTSGAAFLALMLYLPTLHEEFPMEFEEMEGEVRIPGVSPVPPIFMPKPFMSKKNGRYSWFVYHGRRFCDLQGIIVNTFAELQSATLRAVEEGRCVPDRRTPPVFPVGPVLAYEDADGGARRHECLEWLDQQPTGSVVFLCFGSRGCFDEPQVAEMAEGLERSGHRFLWALRVAAQEEVPMDANLEEVLPEGFAERTKGRGMVWPTWAPQTAILAHRAVGGFVTHCGWNSCLESLRFGVPMLGWPLYAEQHLNAVVMAEDMGVALRMEVDRKRGNFVTADELERGVRCLMEDAGEGKRVRAKAKEMMLASEKAWEEGGSSFVNMERLVKEMMLASEKAWEEGGSSFVNLERLVRELLREETTP